MQHTFGAAERINHDAPMLASVPDGFSGSQSTGEGQIHETMARIADIIVESGEGLTLESLIKAFWRTYSSPEGAQGNIVSIHEARGAPAAPVVAEDAFARLASRMDQIAEGLGFVADRVDRVEGRQTGPREEARGDVPNRRHRDDDAGRTPEGTGKAFDLALPDRASFEEELERNYRIARNEVEPLSVAICSVSRIEKIVQSHGMRTAQRLLERVATTLSYATKGECYSARKSGSEFVMMARGITISQFRAVLEQSIADLSARRWHDKFSNEALGMIDMHIGVAHVFDFANPSLAMRAADLAHERAVLEGTSNVVVADAGDLPRA
ncbi:diguanylate cyclase domain-containing protein [Citromicrobium sp. JLT1363]|uniref:diguanylate cyclase domain-containing protein n=1 Tax=Citromicrobium sp. JLT1363 TaxID=517722 RepID=UPI000225DEE7|nr:diguanylate cyclase [Citromicrobium sp. JLT1363]